MQNVQRQPESIVHGPRSPKVGKVVAWAIMILFVVGSLFPIWWVVRTALTAPSSIYSSATSLTPVEPTLDNFRRALGLVSTEEAITAGGSGQSLNFLLYFRNTVIFTFLNVLGQVFFSAMAAYAFARLKFPMRDSIFYLYLAALMIPPIVTLIPNFILVRNLDWINTFQGMLAPSILMSPFTVFFLRQFMLGLPDELEDAARIDGAGPFTIFWRIVLPLSNPALITIAIVTFIHSWNDFLWPYIVARDEGVRVLNVALAIFQSQTPQGAPDWGGLMAGTLITILPVLLVLLFFGRRVVDSLQFSGIK